MEPTPFIADLPAEQLETLRSRLHSTRWPGPIGDDSWTYGVPEAWMREMVNYWADEWDWHAQAEAMNQWQHYRVTIDGVPIHYLHAPARDLEAPPLVLTHGWPWTFWDFKDVIGPLSRPEDHGGDASDAFNVYVPSLPGFGFSTPLSVSGVDVAVIGDLWVKLMTDVLGFESFAAHGGDWGGLVTAQLAHAHADKLVGAHLSIALMPGVDRRSLGPDAWAPDEQWMIERGAESEPLIRSHVTVHLLDPQTLAYSLVDSPVGTAAWIWERRRNWSDCDGDVETVFDRDHLCTTAALYWCTGAIHSSLRLYHEHFKKPWPLTHERTPRMEAPTAFAIFPKDVVHMPRSVIAEHCDLRRYTVMPAGGHFGAAEQPDLLVDDIRAFFASLQ
ncbi:MAG: epoxide hydrolase family protein [Acidimicrobiales bacterium]